MNIFDYIVPISVAAVFVVLVAGLWNMMRGRQRQHLPKTDALEGYSAVHSGCGDHGGDLVFGRLILGLFG